MRGPVIETYRGKDGWRWRAKAANYRIVAESGEGYTSMKALRRGLAAALKALRTGIEVALCVALVAVGMGGAGCLNLGGGRQLVTLPWSYPAVAMDATGSQIKNGAQAGAQFAGEGPSVPATGDQVMTIGQNQSNQRSTDASLAD